MGFFEDGFLGLAAEVYISDAEGFGVATDPIPFVAAVEAGPGVENAETLLLKGGLES